MDHQYRRIKGFTLLELIVVLFLVTLTVGIAATQFSAGTEGAEMRSEARKLVALLRQTRAKAVAESQTLGITTPPQFAGYRLQPEGKDIFLPDRLTLEISATNQDVAAPSPGIYFYPDGTSNGGTLTFQSDKGSAQLQVNWLTGEVSLVED